MTFHHSTITVPQITPDDKLVNSITKLKSELSSILIPDKDNQIEAIANLRNTYSKHSNNWDTPNKNSDETPT